MIRPVYKASGTNTAKTSTGTTTGTAASTSSAPSGGQIAGSVTNTAIKEGAGLAAGILSGGATYVLEAITSVFTGAFNLIGTLGTTRNNNAAATAQLYWYKAGDRNDDRETNNGFYAIMGLAIIGFIVYLIVKQAKSK